MNNKGPPPINYATRPTPINHATRPPPPIDLTTHPRRSALTNGGTQAASPPAPTILTGPSTATSSAVEVHDCSVESLPVLAEANDGLSTNNVIHSPGPAVSPGLRRRHRRDMYYSVIVGKCCGVYFSWATVRPLVINVPGSFFTEFRSLEGAYWDYNEAKKAGKVRAVREAGDEDIYGPLSRACM